MIYILQQIEELKICRLRKKPAFRGPVLSAPQPNTLSMVSQEAQLRSPFRVLRVWFQHHLRAFLVDVGAHGMCGEQHWILAYFRALEILLRHAFSSTLEHCKKREIVDKSISSTELAGLVIHLGPVLEESPESHCLSKMITNLNHK